MPSASPMAFDLHDSNATECVPGGLRSAYDVADPDTPETLLGPQQTRNLLRDAVSGLTPQHRLLIELRYDMEWSFEEIAHYFHVQVPAVSKMHTRALGCLRESLALMGCEGMAEL